MPKVLERTQRWPGNLSVTLLTVAKAMLFAEKRNAKRTGQRNRSTLDYYLMRLRRRLRSEFRSVYDVLESSLKVSTSANIGIEYLRTDGPLWSQQDSSLTVRYHGQTACHCASCAVARVDSKMNSGVKDYGQDLCLREEGQRNALTRSWSASGRCASK